MNDNYIRDRTGRIIGRFDGNILRDGTGKIVARYDESDDRTRDATGRIVGDGDLRLFQVGKNQPTNRNSDTVTANGPGKNESGNSSNEGR